MIPYINTGDVLTILWSDGTPRQVTRVHRHWTQIKEYVTNSTQEPTAQDYKYLEELITPLILFKTIAVTGDIVVGYNEEEGINCKAFGKDYPLDASLASTILAIYIKKGNITPFINFIAKVVQNPDQDIANQLWKFIEVCGLCLTPDGNFLAYKNVNTNFTSIYDGETDNTPGTVLGMPRNLVEKNPDLTCSVGLHFAAWGYLKHYSSGGKTVLVSISPKDVVSIPSDYSFKKGRACRYRIVREVEQPEELKNLHLFEEDGTQFDEDYNDSDDYDDDCDDDDIDDDDIDENLCFRCTEDYHRICYDKDCSNY